MKRFIFITIYLLGYLPLFNAQAQTPFNKGVNLTGWFQTSGARQIQFTKYTKHDFENIKSLGCDVIRLPINLHTMVGAKPGYTIDPIFFEFLDQAVTWAEDLNIYLLLDNHSTDDIASQNPDLTNILSKIWAQMATHYKNRSKYILYEIMNEPNGLTTANWIKIQQTAIDSIRKFDTTHTIIVGASNYNSYNDLNLLPIYNDKHIIYTFHFYDPFLFTHEGATWVNPSMAPLERIPFPYNADSMPPLPSSLKGTWVNDLYNNYKIDGTVSKIHQLIDTAVAFKNRNHVNIYCGEFGVFMQNSIDSNRVYWYQKVHQYLEEKGISWTIWDYQGGFGLFKKGSNALFDYDLNISLIKALGLNVPVQKVFEMRSDSVGFNIYKDYISDQISESSGVNGGSLDFYSQNKPNNGQYCILWTGSAQYGYVGFDFTPNKDLSKLVASNYALSFLVRGNAPGTKFDVRFIDTKTTDTSDHPWRMNYVVDESIATWDAKWHKIFIPLKNFTEQGSYDNGTWYNPVGKFDWKTVDVFDIVAEHSDLKSKVFWFDNISVSDMDTAHIYDTSTYTFNKIKSLESSQFYMVYPNPARYKVTFSCKVPHEGNVDIDIYNLSGQKVNSLTGGKQNAGLHTLIWNLSDVDGIPVSDGLYVCRISLSGDVFTTKISVIK